MREEFLYRLEEELEASTETGAVTVDTEDLENLIKAYKSLKSEIENLESEIVDLQNDVAEGEY